MPELLAVFKGYDVDLELENAVCTVFEIRFINVEVFSQEYQPALTYAIRMARFEHAEALLKMGVDVHHADRVSVGVCCL